MTTKTVIKSLGLFSLLFGALGTSLSANAQGITVVPSIGYGMSTLKFDRSVGESDVSRFSMVDFALTAAYKRFYIRANTEVPMGEEYTYGPALIRQFKREDFGVAAGYYFFNTFSVFGGYSYGKTSIITFDGASATPFSAIYTQHRDAGPFIGANYSIYIGKRGSIGINAAYAFMDGALIVQNSDPGGVSTNESGTTSGFSLGLSWSDTLKNKATYYVAYKFKSYKTELTTISINKNFNIISMGFVFPI